MANVRIRGGEGSHRRGGVARKQQHRSVDGVLECAAQDELSPRVCLPREREMLVPECSPTFHVVGNDVVKEKVVHLSGTGYFFGFAAAALASMSVAIIR